MSETRKMEILATVVAIIIGLFLSEGICRLNSFLTAQPTQKESTVFRSGVEPAPINESTGYQRTKVANLSWVSLPGTYQYRSMGRTIEKTIWKNGSRATRNKANPGSPPDESIIFFGDSFIEGSGLSDYETAAWITQNEFPQRNVYNFAVGGHGLCQTLVIMRRIFDSDFQNPIVIVRFADYLVARNIGDTISEFESSLRSDEATADYPICSLDHENNIVLDAPRHFAFTESWFAHSSLITTFYKLYILLTMENTVSLAALTESIFKEMNELVKERNGKLILLFSRSSLPDSFQKFNLLAKKMGIATVNERGLSKKDNLPDGHPGPIRNRSWVELLKPHLLH